MAVDLVIGRVGAAAPFIESVSQLDSSGSTLSITAQSSNTTLPQAIAMRNQLLGYVDNPDEAFIPVTYAGIPGVDGYYTVTSVDATVAAEGVVAGVVTFSIRLERVQNFAGPLIEVATVGALRTNTVGITTMVGNPQKIALPNDATAIVDYGSGVSFMRTPDHFNTGNTGGAAVMDDGVLYKSNGAVQYAVAPGSFYEGASSVYLGSDLIVGRAAAVGPTQPITLSNGSFEMLFPVSGSTFQFQTRVWTGSAWTPYQTYTLGNGGNFPSAATFTVMRNSPEQVTVRIRTNTPNQANYMVLDVGLKRGDYHATFNSTLDSSQLSITTAVATGGSSVLSGAGYSVAVTSGVAYIASSTPFTTGTNFHLSVSDQVWRFAIGYRPTSNAVETTNYCVSSYFWASSQRQSVVAS